MARLFASFLMVFIAYTGIASPPFIVDEAVGDHFLKENCLEVLEDNSRKLTVSNITDPEIDAQFKRVINEVPKIKNTSAAYWIRFSIKSDQVPRKRWVLENIDPHIDNFEFYQRKGNDIIPVGVAGYLHPFGVREYHHKNFVFDLPIDTTENVFYARVTSNTHNPFLFKIRTFNYFAFYALNEYYLLGMFYGIVLIVAIYNFLLYTVSREKIYMYYFLYALSCILVCLSEDATGFQYLWPDLPWINMVIKLASPALLLISFTVYSKNFLELKKYFPLGNKILNISVLLYFIFYFSDIFIIKSQWNIPFPLYLIPFSIIYLASYICYRKGLKFAKYFILGYSFMFVGVILLIFRINGVTVWDDIFTVYSFNMGIVFEIVILSIALGDRFRQLKKEKEVAQEKTIDQLKKNQELKDNLNKELEVKVEERTLELKEKNGELEEAYKKLEFQADEISRMNKLLNQENETLQGNVKELTKARVMLQDVDFKEFSKIFPDKESCLQYLSELKWKNGYECKKCKNLKYYEIKDVYSRRCTRCGYLESATAFTIFHKLKFPITKAFYMLFLIYANKHKITSHELSEILDLRQSTCWSFSKKISSNMTKWEKQKSSSQDDGWGNLVLDPEDA